MKLFNVQECLPISASPEQVEAHINQTVEQMARGKNVVRIRVRRMGKSLPGNGTKWHCYKVYGERGGVVGLDITGR